jgi:peptidoglycan/LPS O-acetylase OafA/YrhL
MKPQATGYYRPDIDGLRAVAVLAVVGYHALPGLVPGGFVGVDIFFVISGYLISRIVLTDINKNTFSWTKFFGGRIRRLFPALIVTLVAVIGTAWSFLLPHEFKALGSQVAAGSGYVINFTFGKEPGYFDAASDVKPLLHLWSLSVEEQFYLVWPLFLIWLSGRRVVPLGIGVVIVLSFAWSLSSFGRKSAFFLPHNRVWELACGALLASATLGQWATGDRFYRLQQYARQLASPQWRHYVAVTGAMMVAACIFGFNRAVTYPGVWAILPCFGTALLIAAGADGVVNRQLLGRSVFVAIGLISYPLYLWHWPMLSFATIAGYGDHTLLRCVLIAAALLAATATYIFVERPLRHRPGRALPVTLFATSLCLLLVGLGMMRGMILPRLSDDRHSDISHAAGDWGYPDGLRRTVLPSGLVIYDNKTEGDQVLFAGDSTMQQYWPRVGHRIGQSRRQQAVVFAAIGACAPIPGVIRKSTNHCDPLGRSLAEVARNPSVRAVVLTGLWSGYLTRIMHQAQPLAA